MEGDTMGGNGGGSCGRDGGGSCGRIVFSCGDT